FLALPDGRSRLLRNGAAATFEDRTATSGLRVAAGVSFAEALDYDQDGGIDLVLATSERELLYRNLGDFLFEEVHIELPEAAPVGVASTVTVADRPEGGSNEPGREPSPS